MIHKIRTGYAINEATYNKTLLLLKLFNFLDLVLYPYKF